MLDPDNETRDEQQERRKLILRAGVAALVLLVLLMGLYLFDHRSKQEPDSQEPVQAVVDDASVSPPTIGISLTTSSTSSSSSSEASTSSSSASAIPEELQQAIAEAPDTAQVALQKTEAKPRAVPERRSAQNTGQPESASPAESILAVPQLPATGSGGQPAEGGIVRPATRVSAAASSDARSAPAEPDLPATPIQVTPTPALPAGSFAVQLGVFANVSNAEELRERLRREGIPAQLETRVQVGPFRNREEALRAQEKLRKLGLGRGMLVVAGKKL